MMVDYDLHIHLKTRRAVVGVSPMHSQALDWMSPGLTPSNALFTVFAVDHVIQSYSFQTSTSEIVILLTRLILHHPNSGRVQSESKSV
jgi:hypothetical protein